MNVVYKGAMHMGSKVTSDLLANAAASGNANMVLAFADHGGSGGQTANVAPGLQGACTVQTNAGKTGTLDITVTFGNQSDTGTLTTFANGVTYDTDTITGDTMWRYSLA